MQNDNRLRYCASLKAMRGDKGRERKWGGEKRREEE
jgi:hypothetical protein